jgi:arylformamidase
VTARWLDVTVPIRAGMPVYEGDPDVRAAPHAAIARGDPANVTRLDLGTHTGTHIDAPRHFIEGATPVDALPLDVLVGPAHVLDLTRVAAGSLIEIADLAPLLPARAERVILKTATTGAGKAFRRDFAALSGEAARLLVARGVRLVAIDSWSIDAFDAAGFPAHHALLGADVVVVEGLDLAAVAAPCACDLVVLPLRLEGLDGAPARAIVRPRRSPGESDQRGI